ncbi:hypothetical protein Vadar_004854 [Vaccinium darrowii]|uniref:Uncharacterized protein n=1 Tax=Vaccinium darrowii TaxID=229202 RepID=A0ACB7Z1J8_9ERIC|nr:hypothetical protein Vadar_004854 [Vaccinium darrowii]
MLIKLKDKQGKFKESLIGDVRGLLSLHEALEFTTTYLISALPNLSNNPIEAQVAHALIENQPIHKGLTRLESRHFISCYEQNDSHNKVLLDFAKLDFNLLQKLHQRELSEFTRWWKELDVGRNFAFARDRVVELYFWILGVYYETQYFPALRILTKVICLISIIDDMYDASNATIEELVLFDDAIHRLNSPLVIVILIGPVKSKVIIEIWFPQLLLYSLVISQNLFNFRGFITRWD